VAAEVDSSAATVSSAAEAGATCSVAENMSTPALGKLP